MLKLVIGDKNLSSWSLRPWLALKVAKIPFEEINITLDRPDTDSKILKWSPSGKVPALIDNDTVICESLAICEYAAELQPQDELWPEDSKLRAVARSISTEMHAGFGELRSHMPMRCAESVSKTNVPKEVQEDIDRIVDVWTGVRQKFGSSGPFLFGSFTIADAMFAPVTTRFRTYGVEVPKIAHQYIESIFSLPEMKEWLAGARAELSKVGF